MKTTKSKEICLVKPFDIDRVAPLPIPLGHAIHVQVRRQAQQISKLTNLPNTSVQKHADFSLSLITDNLPSH